MKKYGAEKITGNAYLTRMKGLFIKHMGVIGSLGQLLFYFQAFNIFWDKNAGEVSLIGFSISLISLNCWLAYGIFIKDKPLITANVVGIIGAFLVVLGIMLFGSKILCR